MSKIIKALNVMVSNPDLITSVISGELGNEIFFQYDNKHVWSIIKTNNNDYFLHYYPHNDNISSLASIPPEYWEHENITSIVYSTKELGSKEAYESFQELFNIVMGKLYNMDSVLDDIISSGDFF